MQWASAFASTGMYCFARLATFVRRVCFAGGARPRHVLRPRARRELHRAVQVRHRHYTGSACRHETSVCMVLMCALHQNSAALGMAPCAPSPPKPTTSPHPTSGPPASAACRQAMTCYGIPIFSKILNGSDHKVEYPKEGGWRANGGGNATGGAVTLLPVFRLQGCVGSSVRAPVQVAQAASAALVRPGAAPFPPSPPLGVSGTHCLELAGPGQPISSSTSVGQGSLRGVFLLIGAHHPPSPLPLPVPPAAPPDPSREMGGGM